MTPRIDHQLNKKNINRILILGHTGFIGIPLLEIFRSNLPDIEVVGLSRFQHDLTNMEHVEAMKDMFDLNTVVVMLSGIKKQLGDNLEIFSQNLKMVENISRLLLPAS